MAQSDRARAAAVAKARQGKPVVMKPCTVTSTSPLQVTIGDTTLIDADGIAGATYTAGADAWALYTSPGTPVILPLA